MGGRSSKDWSVPAAGGKKAGPAVAGPASLITKYVLLITLRYPFFFSKSFMNATSASIPSIGNAL